MTLIGKIPYRFVIMQLSELFTLTLVSDPNLEINDLYQVSIGGPVNVYLPIVREEERQQINVG